MISMIDNSVLELCVKRAVNILTAIDKVLALYYNYAEKMLTFDLIVTKKLEDDELEEARIAQTELLADFPDGEIKVFIINQYRATDGTERTTHNVISGELFYESDEMKRRRSNGMIKGYAFIDSEKAEMEGEG